MNISYGLMVKLSIFNAVYSDGVFKVSILIVSYSGCGAISDNTHTSWTGRRRMGGHSHMYPFIRMATCLLCSVISGTEVSASTPTLRFEFIAYTTQHYLHYSKSGCTEQIARLRNPAHSY